MSALKFQPTLIDGVEDCIGSGAGDAGRHLPPPTQEAGVA
jgi:hypothetical protein